MTLDDRTVDTTVRWIATHLFDSGIAIISVVHPKSLSLLRASDGQRAFIAADHRAVAWYQKAIEGSGMAIDGDEEICVPNGAAKLGDRFAGLQAGFPLFWLAAVSRRRSTSVIL